MHQHITLSSLVDSARLLAHKKGGTTTRTLLHSSSFDPRGMCACTLWLLGHMTEKEREKHTRTHTNDWKVAGSSSE